MQADDEARQEVQAVDGRVVAGGEQQRQIEMGVAGCATHAHISDPQRDFTVTSRSTSPPPATRLASSALVPISLNITRSNLRLTYKRSRWITPPPPAAQSAGVDHLRGSREKNEEARRPYRCLRHGTGYLCLPLCLRGKKTRTDQLAQQCQPRQTRTTTEQVHMYATSE